MDTRQPRNDDRDLACSQFNGIPHAPSLRTRPEAGALPRSHRRKGSGGGPWGQGRALAVLCRADEGVLEALGLRPEAGDPRVVRHVDLRGGVQAFVGSYSEL
jgi:hypothetical protein